MKSLLAILLIIPVASIAQSNPTYNEKYRPQFHFTPPINWINDPNGLVFYKGEYHLFYQYNPYGIKWGHMSWGHAVSPDLVHWKHLPVAIPEDDHNMIFSGSCVIDKNNTTGFAEKPGQVPMIAIYTAHIIPDKSKPDDYLQNQHIAFSLDDGRTWKKYSGNPVLDQHKKDFRDPKVFWYAPSKKWIMATVLPHEHIVQFFSSPNLKEWEHLSNFGPAGDTNDIWECPDLVQVPLSDNRKNKKWVLLNSQQTTMQYFVGTFDGKRFVNENPADKIFRPDFGPDFYAGITYNNLPAGHHPILLGWANNWKYAQDIPTSPWRSAMSMPRELSLRKKGNTWMLLEQPVASLQKLRIKKEGREWKNVIVRREKPLRAKAKMLELDITLSPAKTGTCGVHIAKGPAEFFIIGYNADSKQVYIDRSNIGDTTFHKDFSSWSRSETDVTLKEGKLRLHIFFDVSIIEVFVNDGEKVITAQLFPGTTANGVILFSERETIFNTIKVWLLKSAW